MAKGIHGAGHKSWQDRQFKRATHEIAKQEREDKWRHNRQFINNIGSKLLERGFDYMTFEIKKGQYIGTILRLHTDKESLMHGEIRVELYKNSRNQNKSQDGKISFEETQYPTIHDRLLVNKRIFVGFHKPTKTSIKPRKKKKAKRVRVGGHKRRGNAR